MASDVSVHCYENLGIVDCIPMGNIVFFHHIYLVNNSIGSYTTTQFNNVTSVEPMSNAESDSRAIKGTVMLLPYVLNCNMYAQGQ